MEGMRWFTLLLCLALSFDLSKAAVEEITNHAEFKSLLKSRNNVLILFNSMDKDNGIFEQTRKIWDEAAQLIKGEGTLGFVDCTPKEGQKLCKLVKGISPDKVPFLVKHYKNGEFNKVYERSFAVETIRRFMLDPDGPVPYADEPGAESVLHPEKHSDFLELLDISPLPVLTMFYAPWCGYCKKLKPTFNEVAKELVGEVIVVAVDLTKAENKPLQDRYKIPGYPTLIRFSKGEQVVFEGDRSKESIVTFAKDPKAPPPPKKKTSQEAFFKDSEVVVLNDDNFEDFISKNPSVGVMFYAPWCRHCKNVKPEFEKAAAKIKKEGIKGALAAVDSTINSNIAKKYDVKSFPTFLYFKDGKKEFQFDERTSDKLVNFMKKPTAPPSPAPPPISETWSVDGTNVLSLNSKNFDIIVEKAKYSFIIFYSPKCSHCKSAKPSFFKAAEKFSDNSDILFGAVDCTVEKELCKKREIYGYPSFEFLQKDDKARYTGPRGVDDFVSFIKANIKEDEGTQQEQPHIDTFEFAMNIAIATPDTFDNLVEVGKRLIMFFKPEDETIDRILRAFNDAGELMTPGTFVVIDCTTYEEFCKSKDVKEYPTFHLYEEGDFDKVIKGTNKEMFVSAISGKTYVPPFDFGEHIRVADHLNFDKLISGKKSLVFFFAPWCGHCKEVKPEFIAASARHKSGLFIAVDCTIYQVICNKYGIKSFPTLIFFHKGEIFGPFRGSRSASGFVAGFSKTKEELAPKNEDEFAFADEVKVAADDKIDNLIGKEKTLVMFYAPWCGHCKLAKPEFNAASILRPDGKFAAVDCTQRKALCEEFKVNSFPTFLIFEDGKLSESYDGPRTIKAFKEIFNKKRDTGKKSDHIEL